MERWSSARSWLMPWRRGATVPSIDDAADRDDPAGLGTAFGLDLSLTPHDERPDDRRRAADELRYR